MGTKPYCSADGCPRKVYARGLCRVHLGISPGTGRGAARQTGSGNGTALAQRMRALERELHRAEQMYRVVVGAEGRLRWRREINSVKDQLHTCRAEMKTTIGGAAR